MRNISQLFNLTKAKPVVVAAMQSPHLLNIWKDSKEWNLYYDLLGDHSGLEESKDKEVPSFTSSRLLTSDVDAVLVTTPLQLEKSRHKYPKAKKFWVVHTGYFLEVFPSRHIDEVDGIITLTRSVMNIQKEHKPGLEHKGNFVITPYYETHSAWQWKEGVIWTVRSRANDRMAPSKDRFEYVMSGIARKNVANAKILFYGSGSPDGYLDKSGKIELFAGSSCYVSALPENAGFGLAEHEALSQGVPIVGSRWGDIDEDMPKEYESLTSSEDEMIEYALELARNGDLAERLSKIGLDYIKQHRNIKNMNIQVKMLADFLR